MAGRHLEARDGLLAVSAFLQGEDLVARGQVRDGRRLIARAVRATPGNAWYLVAWIASVFGSRAFDVVSRATGLGSRRSAGDDRDGPEAAPSAAAGSRRRHG